MATDLVPLQVPSLKEACITRLEHLILSGEFKVGEELPSERKLAESLAVSRPVVHEALVDLAAKGLVTILPRKGVVVNDFRTTGSCALLATLLDYHEGELDPRFMESLVAMRMLIEAETARLAASHRTQEDLARFAVLLAQEADLDPRNVPSLAESAFFFHLQVALASGNLMYPLILNSFRGIYTNIAGKFFARNQGTPAAERLLAFHRQLGEAIAEGDSQAAADLMTAMIRHGAEHM